MLDFNLLTQSNWCVGDCSITYYGTITHAVYQYPPQDMGFDPPCNKIHALAFKNVFASMCTVVIPRSGCTSQLCHGPPSVSTATNWKPIALLQDTCFSESLLQASFPGYSHGLGTRLGVKLGECGALWCEREPTAWSC